MPTNLLRLSRRRSLIVALSLTLSLFITTVVFADPAPPLTFVEVQKDESGGVDGLDGAADVAVSPDGAYVYAAGFIDDALAVFSRDAGTGKLTFVEVQEDGTGGVDPR